MMSSTALLRLRVRPSVATSTMLRPVVRWSNQGLRTRTDWTACARWLDLAERGTSRLSTGSIRSFSHSAYEEHHSASTAPNGHPRREEEHQHNPPPHLMEVHPDRLVVAFPQKQDIHHLDISSNSNDVNLHAAAPPVSSSIFHASWLWSNDPNFVHTSSGQRLRSPCTFFTAHAEIHAARFLNMVQQQHRNSIDQDTQGTIPVEPPAKPPRGSLHPIGGPYHVEMVEGIRHDYVPSREMNHHPSAQRTLLSVKWKTTTSSDPQTNIEKDDASLLPNKQFHETLYDADWLARCRYDDDALHQRHMETIVMPQQSLHAGYAVQTMNYHVLMASDDTDNSPDVHHMKDDARFDLLHAVVEEGAALVQGALAKTHESEDTVGFVGRLLSGGALSHGSLYGDIFHVKSEPHAHNIAYTAQALPPHQDLAYYESPPGLQLLHCLQNSSVDENNPSDGASVLVDGLAAAEEFRRLAPDLFDVLTRCDATFCKQREGADMVYRRPHIRVSPSSGNVVSVHWSPPFEGPLSIPAQQVEDYFVAYSAWQRMLDNALPRQQRFLPMLPEALEQDLVDYAHRFTWEYRLERGDMLIFNNQRMLHGRRAFNTHNNNSTRHLVGCYTNLDDTLNQYRLLRRQRYPHLKELPYMRLPGNGSSSVV